MLDSAETTQGCCASRFHCGFAVRRWARVAALVFGGRSWGHSAGATISQQLAFLLHRILSATNSGCQRWPGA
eukprot:15453268-Alexandrium_andersonii.AAC.1